MATRPSSQPPPDDGARRRRRFPWSRNEERRPGRRARARAAYERSDAAEQERVIVQALAALRDMDVREVMTPRMDVAALSIPVSADDVARAVRESGHSAFPVVNGGLDDVVGVLYVNDLFRSRRSGRGALFTGSATAPTSHDAAAPGESSPAAAASPASPAPAASPASPLRHPPPPGVPDADGLSPLEVSRRVRQPYVIPESRPILAALVEMRRHRRGFAVVVDEYGGLAGVLTVKDLLEPIVGDLQDELDADEGPSIVRVDSARWLVDGTTNVDEVRERLGLDVPEGDYVTIGGYLLDGLGHIPTVGEALRVDGWELTIQEMDKRRIASVVARHLAAGKDRRAAASEASPAPAPPAPAAHEWANGASVAAEAGGGSRPALEAGNEHETTG